MMLAEDIECNIREAEEKITTAYKLRNEHQNLAFWYRDMAAAHLNFNNKGHDLIAAEISAYKNGEEHAAHPEYAEGMQAVWNAKHAELIAYAARVRSMIDTFK